MCLTKIIIPITTDELNDSRLVLSVLDKLKKLKLVFKKMSLLIDVIDNA
jgi:hypothetical protein